MLFPAKEPLRGKDAGVVSLNEMRYMLPVFVSFFTNPPRDLRITRRVILLYHPTIRFVHIVPLHDDKLRGETKPDLLERLVSNLAISVYLDGTMYCHDT